MTVDSAGKADKPKHGRKKWRTDESGLPPSKRAAKGLTIKQERFCQVYVSTGNATEAYRSVYNCANSKPSSINEQAQHLLRDLRISTRTSELQAEYAKANGVTVESITKELEQARVVAEREGQAGSMVAASMGKAKLHGLVTEKVDARTIQFVAEIPAPAPTTESWLASIEGPEENTIN
jgi:hypothetical protein